MKKIENTIENKVKFFAQYIGSQVEYPDLEDKLIKARLDSVGFDEIMTTYKRKRNGCKGDYLSWEENNNHKCNALNAKLLLKSLSEITDEDAIEVARIIMVSTYEKQSPNFKEVIREFINSFDSRKFSFDITQQTIDFLRFKGYKLPWMGLSVEDQVKYGWVKFKEK